MCVFPREALPCPFAKRGGVRGGREARTSKNARGDWHLNTGRLAGVINYGARPSAHLGVRGAGEV